MNRFSLGRYLLTLLIVVLGFLYALPNVYNIRGEDPALQIKAKESMVGDIPAMNQKTADSVIAMVPHKNADFKDGSLLISFNTDLEQNDARSVIQKQLGDNYIVAPTKATQTPAWLLAIGAKPMNYGLDLQGGMHLLMKVSVDDVLDKQLISIRDSLPKFFSNHGVSLYCIYPGGRDYDYCPKSAPEVPKGQIQVAFPITPSDKIGQVLARALNVLQSGFSNVRWVVANNVIEGTFPLNYQEQQRQLTMTQVVQTLNQRVNQLGVSDAAVVQQPPDRVAIDMPGLKDAAQAKNIIGEVATLEFHLVNTGGQEALRVLGPVVSPRPTKPIEDGDPLLKGVRLPPDTEILVDKSGRPYLLDKHVVLTGEHISSASANVSQQGVGSVINIGLSGNISDFEEQTAKAAANHNQPMATVFIEQVPIMGPKNTVLGYDKKETIINVANVIQGLNTQFQITGLGTLKSAQDLALLLRAGSLAANVAPLEEEMVGPSLGAANVHQGLLSIAIGFVAIVIFMMIYYGVFGVIANIALFANLFLQIGLLSLMGATLTLPGIAGIVLTLGMAVDANVLIYERIREELRSGNTIQASLHAGFERAFVTIVDANVTTLIVAGVLFWVGAGPVKGFAVTLSIGILTSLFTAIMVTRAVVNLIYGGRVVKKLSIGMRRSAGKS